MFNLLQAPHSSSPLEELFQTVVDGGFCIGCGACASLQGSPIVMKLDEYGMFKATLDSSKTYTSQLPDVQSVCPFSNSNSNEDTIGEKLFGAYGGAFNDKLGYYLSTYAGYVEEGEFRKQGSSGGMGSWLASSLLENNYVDSVIQVHSRHPTSDDRRLFHYQLSTTTEEIEQAAKSRYYPVELSEMISLIRERPGRYAVFGLPCFIKSIRLLSDQDPIIAERIQFCIGLICGHLKSTRFAELFGWQAGIHPEQLTAIDFRTKLPGRGANQYGVTVTGVVKGEYVTVVTPPIRTIFGANWGYGFFKYKACDYCDDVVAETADVTIGDAWLPQYINDSEGTNILIVRHPIMDQIIQRARREKMICVDSISSESVIESQAAGFAHRREGLAYRLSKRDPKHQWKPVKRVKPGDGSALDLKQEYRMKMAQLSHRAFNMALHSNNLTVLSDTLQPLVRQYSKLYRRPLWERIRNRISKGLVFFFSNRI